ncbi:MAG: protein-export chaperone SecB [Gammaproteobacteria bacterium]|nr:protein-export chaperone SecB [Gammaproteobacteria bacterium]
MSNDQEPQATQQAPQLELGIQRVYIKDVSFETPNSPEIFTAEWKPNMDINLGTETKKLSDNIFEVVLKVTVTVKSEEKTAFLAEVHQAGIFMIKGLEESQLAPVFGITCPNILFPYVREAVSDLVNKGSFPQLVLSPINFEALFAQQMQQQQSKEAQH